MAGIRSSLWILIGLVAGTKQITQPGACGLHLVFPARTIGAGSSLEVAAEIGTLLIGDLLRILLAAPACQAWIIGSALAASMQIRTTLRTHSQTAEWQRLIGERGTTLPANKDVRHRIMESMIIWRT
jgi:hypothetical protein